MLTLFGNLDSGNCHKVQMLLAMTGRPFRRVDVQQPLGQPRHPAFLALNPIGKVPALLTDEGDVLSESGAILYWLGAATPLWPAAERDRTEVLRWMFFEQYNHEPALAVMRYLVRFVDDPAAHAAEVERLRPRAHRALDAMQARLGDRDWLAAGHATLADIALYPYTRLGAECALDIDAWPAVAAWVARVETIAGFLPVYADAATEVVAFRDWFRLD